MEAEETIREKFGLLSPQFDERARRAWAAAEALSPGYGGLSLVHRATGIAISTIRRGTQECDEDGPEPRDLGFSLQANRKVREGGTHPDRNLQFEHINRQVKGRLRRGEPVISVDTKKKELVGSFKNAGREWHPNGKPPEVNVYDFVDPELGKAIPYGVYDIARNEGWVSVGVDHDTAQFAVATIQRWWRKLGRKKYPKSRRLLIVADGGGSNGYRTRLWKVELQKLANKTGLVISVCHLPPGTSKWNKIEHRLFSFISQNWRGKPLLDRATVVNLIASTTTTTGLKVHAYLDTNEYPANIKVSDEDMASLRITRSRFHGEWNYTIRPH